MVQSRAGAPGLPAEQRLLLRSSDAEGPAGPRVAAAGRWDRTGSSAPLPAGSPSPGQLCPATGVAVGLSGERYWVGWRGLVTLPVDAGSGVTSSCQCQAAVPPPALPGEISHDPSLLLFMLNSCEGRINTRVRGCPELAQGINVIMQVCPISSSETKTEARSELLGEIAAEGLMKRSDGATGLSLAQEYRVLLGENVQRRLPRRDPICSWPLSRARAAPGAFTPDMAHVW